MDTAAQLMRLVNGYRISQAIHVAAVLGLSDHLSSGPRSVDELAAATDCHAPSLYRLLRALSAVGLYQHLPDDRFGMTPLGTHLRSDSDGDVANWARFVGRPNGWQSWGALEHSVRTGENAFTAVHGCDVWEYRTRHPAEGALFDAAMTSMTRQVADAILDAYDMGRFSTVVDIGGGHGAMLAAVLNRHPGLRGVLFDQPQVVAGAPPLLEKNGVADRCEVVAGDLFTDELPRGDAYVMKSILHDWPDEQAVAIARNCRQAMKPGATLVILERVLPQPPYSEEATPVFFSDLNMLVNPGGQERTGAEYEALLAQAGLSLARILPTSSEVSVVEARA